MKLDTQGTTLFGFPVLSQVLDMDHGLLEDVVCVGQGVVSHHVVTWASDGQVRSWVSITVSPTTVITQVDHRLRTAIARCKVCRWETQCWDTSCGSINSCFCYGERRARMTVSRG